MEPGDRVTIAPRLGNGITADRNRWTTGVVLTVAGSAPARRCVVEDATGRVRHFDHAGFEVDGRSRLVDETPPPGDAGPAPWLVIIRIISKLRQLERTLPHTGWALQPEMQAQLQTFHDLLDAELAALHAEDARPHKAPEDR